MTLALLLCAVTVLGAVALAPPASAATAPNWITRMKWAEDIRKAMNSERARHGLPPLAMNTLLKRSALAHNRYMMKYNEMSHRLPGEPDLGPRIAATGYTPWCAVGENIAWTTDISLDGPIGLYYLQRTMYNEKPPHDGHRQIILSRAYTEVGINVQYDSAHRKLWMTEDFGRRC